MNARIISNRLVVPLVLVAAASCGRSSSPPADGGRAGQFIDLTHAPGTTAQISLKSGVVDRSATASALVAVSADRSTFLFEHPPAALTNLTSASRNVMIGLRFASCEAESSGLVPETSLFFVIALLI